MEIEYREGDILEGDEEYVVQGCNAQGVMGSGLAKLIRDRYPRVFTEYRKEYEKNGLPLGSSVWVDVSDRIIINAITQEFYGRNPHVLYACYDAIRLAVRGINRTVAEYHQDDPEPARVAFPLIGCGLANGKWSIVSKIIEEEADAFQPVVYLLDGKPPED